VTEVPWWQRGAIYQIYPRSFADSNGDGVGDIPGIVERLDYLNDGTEASLGVEAIWCSPFFRSPMADFGYDIEDYLDVDPVFGRLADVDTLIDEAHRRGIRVILDWVPNHTSDRHPWFLESRASRDSEKRDWYVWRDGRDGGPPNNWRSSFDAVGPAWTFDLGSGQWYLHSFTPQQPDLDWDNPEVEAAMHDTLRFWLDRGVDGFRMDVIHKIAKDPGLRDNDAGVRHDEDWPSIHDRLRRIRAVLDEYDDRMMVGEVYLYDLGRLVEYVNTGDQLHLAHNFTFLHLPWDADAFRAAIDDFEALSTDRAWPAWFLGNHDHSRIATRYGRRQARVAAMLLYTLRGTPFVYQGDELGLPDAPVEPERAVDVDGRDPERAPMPWSPPSEAGPGAGFTTGTPWLPLVSDAEELAVERQLGDPGSLLSLVRRLAWLRRRSEVLQRGEQRSLDAPAGVLAYERTLGGERLVVALDYTGESHAMPLLGGGRVELSTDPERQRGREIAEPVELRPFEGVVVRMG
jgi:alpha-glucosidase